MASEQYWAPLSRTEYDDGRELRLRPDSINAKNWYKSRHIGEPLDELGCYALELLVEVVSIRPIDNMYVVDAYLLDADGQKVGKGDSLFTDDGLIVETGKPATEGYFLDAAEGLGFDLPVAEDRLLLVG